MPTGNHDELLRQAFKQREILLSYAYSILCDWDAAQDAVQETYIAVSNATDLEPGPAFTGWLKRVTRNKAIDIVRSRQRDQKLNQGLQDLVIQSMDSFLEEQNNIRMMDQRRRVLHDCVAKLGEMPRQILRGFYKLGQSCDDLAQEYDRTVNAVRLTLSKSRKSLRKCVAQKLEMG